MQRLTLRNGLVLIVAAALLPIAVLSLLQANSTLSYSRSLLGNQLVTNALATAGNERDPLLLSKQAASTLSANKLVRNGGPGCAEALRSGLGNSPALVNLARSDASGRVLCSVLPLPVPVSVTDQAWWQRGIKSREFFVSGVVMGTLVRKRLIVGVQPLFKDDGTRDGFITVAIDASWLENSLARLGMSQNAAIAVVDASGNVVLTSDARILPRFDVKAGDAKVAEGKAHDGTDWMYAVAPLYGHELFVAYAEPTRLLLETTREQVRINLILPIIALLMASLAIWIGTSRLVLRWLDALRHLAAQIAAGNFAAEPDQFDRAPREIGLLGADLHIMADAIKTRDNDLTAALDAKTALTRDIHHRVKNNLQIVSSLLNLQASKISDPAARDALSQTRARIGALAQIHRLLYEESHDSDEGHVNIANLLTALCSQLRALHRGQNTVHLICDIAPQTVPINSAVPLTLLAVEAVTNAFRHGFPDGRSGMVTLHFDVTGDQATLKISDDGIGYDPAGGPMSMGRQLMVAFTEQLGGVKIVTSSPAGTVVTVRYPFGDEPINSPLPPQ